MRDFVIVRGPQGSGKSSLIREAGLEGHHISPDMMRQCVSGDWMGPNGQLGISQQHNQLVHALVGESLERRMRDGETIAYEATVPDSRALQRLVDQGRRHGYDILVVDLYGMPIEHCLAVNAQRPERVRINEFAVRRCYEEAEGSVIPDGVEALHVSDDASRRAAIARIEAFVREGTATVDLSTYERVVHVGDIQSTFDPLVDPASPLRDGPRDDTAYVFCGDLFDRGTQSAEVARFFMDNFMGLPNVFHIAGNHEDWVEKQSRGAEIGSREWADRTWPALEAAGFTAEHMAAIASHLLPFLRYEWRGTHVLVSHGGFPHMPTALHLLPEYILRHGAGEYGRDADARWNEAQLALPEAERVVQAHGHRNSKMLPVITGEGWSINLEGQVEFGGHQRFAILDASGWSAIQIRAKEFRTMVEAQAIDRAAGRKPFGDEAPLTPWAKRGELELRPLSDETMAKFRDHSMIGETVSETRPTVSSWNFTKSAFYTQNWDSYTSVARGLFVDNVDNTVISRGAEKFYNTGERPETTIEAILAAGHGAAVGYAKENGFFATVGYSERLGELVVTSKSRIEGTFPDMANAMIDAKLGEAGRERMLRFCRDQKACLMFEVVDMAGDPHIIKEPEDKLVLLACIRRDEAFEQVPYDTLKRLASWIGCDVKVALFPKIDNARALESIIRRVGENARWNEEAPVEGIVLEFADGFMVKVKAVYYAAWKKARGAVERIAMTRRKDVEFDRTRYADVPLIQEFLDWAQTLPTEALGLHIIELRDAWTGAADATYTREQVEAMGERPGPKAKDMSGFVKALEGMAARAAAGQAKPDSVAKILAAGATDPDKQAVIDTHPAAGALRAFVADAQVEA